MAPEGVIGPFPVTPAPEGRSERRKFWLDEPPPAARF